jgi:hypothetical protein
MTKREVFRGDAPLRQLVVSPGVFVAAFTTGFACFRGGSFFDKAESLLNEATSAPPAIAVHDQLLVIGSGESLTISSFAVSGSKLERVERGTGRIRCSSSIRSIVFLSAELLAAVGNDGSIHLFSVDGRVLGCVLLEDLTQAVARLPYEERLLVVVGSAVVELEFDEWDAVIARMPLEAACSKLVEIGAGSAAGLVGVPRSLAQLRERTRRMIGPFVTQAIADPRLLTSLVPALIGLDLLDLLDEAVPQIKDREQLFKILFGKQLLRFAGIVARPVVIEAFCESAPEAEEVLLRWPLREWTWPQTVQVAQRLKLWQLLGRTAESMRNWTLAASAAESAGTLPEFALRVLAEPSVRRLEKQVLAGFLIPKLRLLAGVLREAVEALLPLCPVPGYTAGDLARAAIAIPGAPRNVFDLCAPLSEFKFPSAAVPGVVDWALGGTAPVATREAALRAVVPFIQLAPVVAAAVHAGLVGFVSEIHVPKREFTPVLTAMLEDPDSRSLIAPFLETHGGDALLRRAVRGLFAPLLLADPPALARFATSALEEELKGLVDAIQPELQLLLLRELPAEQLSRYGFVLRVLRLLLDFDSDAALPFLKERFNELDADDAERECARRGRVDCVVHILLRTGQAPRAAELVRVEMEEALQALALGRGEAERVAEILRTTNQFKEPKEWQRFILAFQLPLWLAQGASRESITATFTQFLVTALNYLDVNHVFLILGVHFGSFEAGQYRRVLQALLARIDYQRGLTEGLQALLIRDCLELIAECEKVTSAPFWSEVEPKCGVCQRQLAPDAFVLRDCRHAYHTGCAARDSPCVVCSATLRKEPEQQAVAAPGEPPRRVTAGLRKMEFVLNRRWDAGDPHEIMRRTYFGDVEVEARPTIRVFTQTPPAASHTLVEDWPAAQ